MFAIYFTPSKNLEVKETILCFPPFAEEMNKTRRSIVLQARKFARLGYGVLVIDLYGTGDSDGLFDQAEWNIWHEDMQFAMRWLADQGQHSLILWGIRLGACLAVECATTATVSVKRLILWQPVVSGTTFLKQFLRLKVAAELNSREGSVSTKKLFEELASGRSVEVAGYSLSSRLAQQIEALNLGVSSTEALPTVDWIETVSGNARELAPVSFRLIERWRDSGVQVNAYTVAGEPFWNCVEIVVLSELLETTINNLAKST